MMISEFGDWLRSRTNRHKRPFQEETISVYRDADQLRTGEGLVIPGSNADDPTTADQLHGKDAPAAGADT